MTGIADTMDFGSAKVTYAKLSEYSPPKFEAKNQVYKCYPVRAVKEKPEGAVDTVIGDASDPWADVFTLDGRQVSGKANPRSISSLPRGLYVVPTSSGKVVKVRL